MKKSSIKIGQPSDFKHQYEETLVLHKMTHYIVWILVSALYSPLFWNLYHAKWETLDYTHAYFILPLSLWLVWRNRVILKENICKIHTDKNVFSFVFLVLGIIMFTFGWRQDYFMISTLSLVPFLFGLTGFLYGTQVSRMLAFPILYLLLLVPPPLGILDSITLPMRYGISAVTESILKLLAYPIHREGLLLTIGYYDIFMGQPCSGFRSLITMTSLVLVYVYISKTSMGKKIILASFIVPFVLFSNLVRVITICLITYYFGEEAGQGFFHDFSGILVFIITLLCLMGLESLLINREAAEVKQA